MQQPSGPAIQQAACLHSFRAWSWSGHCTLPCTCAGPRSHIRLLASLAPAWSPLTCLLLSCKPLNLFLKSGKCETQNFNGFNFYFWRHSFIMSPRLVPNFLCIPRYSPTHDPLSHPPTYWDFRYISPCPADSFNGLMMRGRRNQSPEVL